MDLRFPFELCENSEVNLEEVPSPKANLGNAKTVSDSRRSYMRIPTGISDDQHIQQNESMEIESEQEDEFDWDLNDFEPDVIQAD